MLTATSTVVGAGIGSDTLSSVESIQGSAFGDTYVATGYNGASASGSIPSSFNEFEGMGGDDTSPVPAIRTSRTAMRRLV